MKWRGVKKLVFPIVKDFHFLIGDCIEPGDESVFQDQEGRICGPLFRLESTDIWEVLVKSGCFVSKGEARKNWRGGALEKGYSEIGPVGKGKTMIFCFNPQTRLSDYED